MKKILKLFPIILIMLIALTGCVNLNYEVTINEDGTADIAYIYGFEKEYLEQMETTSEKMTKEMQENAELSGYTIETYSDDKTEGFKASKHVNDFSEISLEEAFGEENVKDSENNQFKLEKKGFKKVYSQNAEIDLSSMDSSMSTMVKMKYTIKLPAKAEENNANEASKDGKTLTWNLKAGEVNKIDFKATQIGKTVIIIRIVVIVIASIVVIAIIAFGIKLIIEKTKKQKVDKENHEDINDEKIPFEEVIENSEQESDIKETIIEENKTEEDNHDEEARE